MCHLRVEEDLPAKMVEAEETQVSRTLASHLTTLGYNYTSFLPVSQERGEGSSKDKVMKKCHYIILSDALMAWERECPLCNI